MYMAPEIIKGNSYMGTDVDLFSLGVLMLTLRTMRFPFEHGRREDYQYNLLMGNNPALFWQNYPKDLHLTDDFKQLCLLLLQE